MSVVRTDMGGAEFEYEAAGGGDPVVLIHGSVIANAFGLLVAEPALAGRYRLIIYRRRGYRGSSSHEGPMSIAEQAADCRALMEHLGLARAHVVGHSFGGAVALQLAQQVPECVHSLALLEPALMVGGSAEGYRDAVTSAIARYHDAGAAVVVDGFLEARWPGYREPLERALPGAFDQAVVDAAATFETDLPGLLEWSFSEADARAIEQPALVVLGAESEALWDRFGETHRLLLEWLKSAEELVVPGATHLLPVQNPADTARGLAAFLARHPMKDR